MIGSGVVLLFPEVACRLITGLVMDLVLLQSNMASLINSV